MVCVTTRRVVLRDVGCQGCLPGGQLPIENPLDSITVQDAVGGPRRWGSEFGGGNRIDFDLQVGQAKDFAGEFVPGCRALIRDMVETEGIRFDQIHQGRGQVDR